MLVCDTPTLERWRPDRSSSEQPHPEWVRVVCDGVELTNALDWVDWLTDRPRCVWVAACRHTRSGISHRGALPPTAAGRRLAALRTVGGWHHSVMRFGVPIATLLAVAAGALAGSGGAATRSVLDCGSMAVGPTGLPAGRGISGAVCLLHAYRRHCRAAVYELSEFGIDTIARDEFRLVSVGGSCRIKVATSFTVVPQKPRSQRSGECSSLSVRGSDVVAGGCVGSGLPRSFSLTGKH